MRESLFLLSPFLFLGRSMMGNILRCHVLTESENDSDILQDIMQVNLDQIDV